MVRRNRTICIDYQRGPRFPHAGSLSEASRYTTQNSIAVQRQTPHYSTQPEQHHQAGATTALNACANRLGKLDERREGRGRCGCGVGGSVGGFAGGLGGEEEEAVGG